MGKFIKLAVALVAIFCANSLLAAEKVVIEKSPFSKVTFLMYSIDASNTGNPEEQGKIDAQYANVPMAMLLIYFHDVIKDKALLRIRNVFWPETKAFWSDVIIDVCPKSNGMTISYERKADKITLESVVICVPAEADYDVWANAANNFVKRYKDAFWVKKRELLSREQTLKQEAAAEEAKRLSELERLWQGPILVYPSQ